MKTIIVTGGAGFIGSNFIHHIIQNGEYEVVNLDKLSYSGNLENLKDLSANPKYKFVKGSICDKALISSLFSKFQPTAIVHFAAESHVDRSILSPSEFIETNIFGTFQLLEESRTYWNKLSEQDKLNFRFIHVSTDEVYGSLKNSDDSFTENTAYAPNSPYSASKASSDHLARAYYHTYQLPTIITNCSNNYGPYQFPEKLIPLCILRALEGQNIPIYGKGENIRDWLYVEDHCKAIGLVLEKGKGGERYNIGGNCELTNIHLVKSLCKILDEELPHSKFRPHEQLITFGKDRPGHDFRYSIDHEKISQELGWQPEETIESGLRKTVRWYLNNQDWMRSVASGDYRNWVDTHYSGK